MGIFLSFSTNITESTKKHFALRFIALALQEFGVPFMETSARSGLNVELAFTAVAK